MKILTRCRLDSTFLKLFALSSLAVSILASCGIEPFGKAASSDLNQKSEKKVYYGHSTYFDDFGKPYGGCGVPQEFLVDENQKPIPFIALNVQDTEIDAPNFDRPIPMEYQSSIGLWQNGKNCGRWIKIMPKENCKLGGHEAEEGRVCTNGKWEKDEVSDLPENVIYGVIADSCQDPNYWCRISHKHIDIATFAVQKYVDKGLWNNRMVEWEFIDEAPTQFNVKSLKFAWAVKASKKEWPALIVYNLPKGISKVEAMVNGKYVDTRNNSDMGQMFVLPLESVDHKKSQVQIKVYPYSDGQGKVEAYGEYQIEFPCKGRCLEVTKAKSKKL